MKKTREIIQENLKLVDLVIEVLDSRIPVSSRNPVIGDLTGSKSHLTVLNKADLADPGQNILWEKKLAENGDFVVSANCNSGEGVRKILRMLELIQDKKNQDRERKKNLRMMIVGIPNVGKSSLINRLTALYRNTPFSDKYLYAIIVSGYSGGDIVAQQLIGSLNMNKAFILPPHFALMETANAPGSIEHIPHINALATEFAGEISGRLCARL